MTLSMQEILNELADSSLDVTVHLNSGITLHGKIEIPSETVRPAPFCLRSENIGQASRIHFFHGETVSGLSVEDEAAIQSLFSKRRFENRQRPAATVLDFKRQMTATAAELSGMQFQISDLETLDEESRRTLQEIVHQTFQAMKKMAADSLGREGLKNISEFTFWPRAKAELQMQRTGSRWTFVMDPRSVRQMSRMQPEMIQKMIESQIQ